MGTVRERDIDQVELDREQDQPGLEIVKHIAALEDTQPTALPSIWRCIDDMLDELFSTPPAPEANMEVSFEYSGYRITVDQHGSATLVPVE